MNQPFNEQLLAVAGAVYESTRAIFENTDPDDHLPLILGLAANLGTGIAIALEAAAKSIPVQGATHD